MLKKNTYTSRLREGLKSHLASTASTGSGMTNLCCLIRERLESQPFSNHRQSLGTQPRPNQRQGSGSHLTIFSSFTNASDISDVTLVPIEASAMGHLLWHRYCCCLEIKDSTLASRSLCKYTWEVVLYIVLTGKERLGPDIWLKIPQQTKSTKNMMRIT